MASGVEVCARIRGGGLVVSGEGGEEGGGEGDLKQYKGQITTGTPSPFIFFLGITYQTCKSHVYK